MQDLSTLIAAAPAAIQSLPRDPRGYPIPYFVVTLPDGTRDLRIACAQRRRIAIARNLCWICGGPLGKIKALVGGPLSIFNRCFGDWASHKDCAEFAARACPFINGTMARRRTAGMPEEAQPMIGADERVMDYMALYLTKRPLVVEPAGHIRAGAPLLITWWRHGEQVPCTDVALIAWLKYKRALWEAEARRVGLDVEDKLSTAAAIDAYAATFFRGGRPVPPER